MAGWVQFQKFVFRCKKADGRLGKRICFQLLEFILQLFKEKDLTETYSKGETN